MTNDTDIPPGTHITVLDHPGVVDRSMVGKTGIVQDTPGWVRDAKLVFFPHRGGDVLMKTDALGVE